MLLGKAKRLLQAAAEAEPAAETAGLITAIGEALAPPLWRLEIDGVEHIIVECHRREASLAHREAADVLTHLIANHDNTPGLHSFLFAEIRNCVLQVAQAEHVTTQSQ
jgi:hypothetical protein